MSNNSVVIIDGARTPMGGLLGCLAAVPAPELAATAIAATIERSGIAATDIDEVFMGCVLPAALKQCPARQAAIGAGIPHPPVQSQSTRPAGAACRPPSLAMTVSSQAPTQL